MDVSTVAMFRLGVPLIIDIERPNHIKSPHVACERPEHKHGS